MEGHRQSRYAWMAFAAIAIMTVVWVGIQWDCMNLYAAPVVEDLGISRTQFMLVYSILSVISAVVSLFFYGRIESRVGIRRMMLLGGIFNTLSYLSWGFMNSVAMLFLGAALYGCGCSIAGYNTVAAGVNRWFKQRMGSLTGTVHAISIAGSTLFALVISYMIIHAGWRFSFFACAGLSAAATLACQLLYRGSPEELGVQPMYAEEALQEAEAGACEHGVETSKGQGSAFASIVHTPAFWVLGAGYFLLGLTTYALMSTLPLFALDLGLGDRQGLVVSASLFATAAMLVPLGMICDRLGTQWGLALCGLLVVISSVLILLFKLPLAGMIVAAACAGAAYSSCSVTVGVGVKQALGEADFGSKLGFSSGLMYIGLALGPVLTNLVYDSLGTYEYALAACAILAVVMAGAFFTAFIALQKKA